MIMYPIVLKSHPEREDVLHKFQVDEGSTEGNGFELISTWLKLPSSKNATDVCSFCQAVVEIPDGSIEAHLKKYQEEHGGKDAIVRIAHRHKGPGAILPPAKSSEIDKTRVKSIREYVESLEASKQNPDSGI
jgi:hypothetical protein